MVHTLFREVNTSKITEHNNQRTWTIIRSDVLIYLTFIHIINLSITPFDTYLPHKKEEM